MCHAMCHRLCPKFRASYDLETPDWAVGHETPFSIKRHQFREVTRSKSRDDINTMTSGDLDNSGTSKERCDFYIKQKKGHKKPNLDDPSFQKKSKFKSPNFLSKMVNRFVKKPVIFKQPLADCFTENNDPPEAIIKLMVLTYEKGPHFKGVMRVSTNHALAKEIREKIESGATLNLEDTQTLTAASVFKDYLRCIPGGLLTYKLENQWNAFNKDDPSDVKLMRIKEVLSHLPPQNYRMLYLTICLLQHIAKHKEVNQMNPTNLAKCIAPSICSAAKELPGKPSADNLIEVKNSMKIITNVITPLITFMIIKHVEIFGEDILQAYVPFGCAPSPLSNCLEEEEEDGVKESQDRGSNGMMSGNVEDEGDEEMFEVDEIPLRGHTKIHPATRQSNSGTDSDSTHSVLSMADTGVMMRRDDSSIDSLVDRDYYPADSSPTVKSHLSPSNLSRDSGLTLSDTQLYDEDGDITITSNKQYQRSASSDDYLEPHDMFTQGMQRRSEPVPPPRINRFKKPRGGFRSEAGNEQHSYSASVSPQKPSPFCHSASTTALDFLPAQFSKSTAGNMNSSLTHAPLGKRISSDSIGEEDESEVQQKASDFQRIKKGLDIGTIVKSDSGTHLFLREETQPSKYNLESGQRMVSKERFLRQTSATDSTPPVSPQSRYSHSSRESVMSQDSSGQSAPQTPDSLNDKPLTWSAGQDKAFQVIDPRLTQSLNINYHNNLSKSTSNIAKDIEEDDTDEEDFVDGRFATDSESSSVHSQYGDFWSEKHLQKYKPSSLKLWGGKSHEAEEVEDRHHHSFSLMIPSDELELNFSNKSNSLPTNDKHQSLLKGSPPPNVLLKNLQAPTRRESVPEKSSEKHISPHYRRSSADTVAQSPTGVSKSVNALKLDEHNSVTSKPIMITSPISPDSQSSATKAKLSKYVVSSLDLRPDKPPCYQQTLQRQFMLKQNVPVDIYTDDKQRQKENSYHAKAMYEKSLRQYNEQRKSEAENRQTCAKTESNSSSLDYERSKLNPVISQSVNYSHSVDVLHCGGASKDLSGSPDGYDDSGASGFIDLGSIPNNSQEDLIRRRNTHIGSGQISGYKTSSPVSISRTDSKLSDTGSSSGSSATLSTLSRHSDSFGRRSDISNVTVSSVTSSDSSSDANSVMSRRKSSSGLDLHNMSYSRHFRPVDHDDDDDSDEDEEYVTLKKDPQKVYQESVRIFYEKGNPSSQNFHSAETPLSSSSSSSSSTTYSITPRSSIDHSVESKSSAQHIISTPTPQRVGTVGSSNSKGSEHSQQLNRQDSHPKQVQNSVSKYNTEPEVENRSEPQRKFSLTEMSSDEHHNNFLKVRSLFYNPEDEKISSPQPSPRFLSSTQPPPVTSTQNISKNIPTENPPPSFPPQKPSNTKPSSNPVPSSSSDNKDLPWSVQQLKMLYDNKDEPSKKSSVQRRSPPPYQNPPPFRRSLDNSRASTSSNSSAGSETVHSKSNMGPHRLGPQAARDEFSFNSSCSSSEESYGSSSLDRRSRKSSLQDSESLSDNSSITYV